MTRESRAHHRAKWRPGSDYNLSSAEAAVFLRMSRQRLALFRRLGLGPPHRKFRGKIWYSLEELVVFAKLHGGQCSAPSPKNDSGGDG
jgi:hypothetical protein